MRISSDTAVHQGLNRDKGGFAGHLPTEGLLSQASDTETPGAGDTEMAKNKLPAFPVCFSSSDNSQPYCRLGGGAQIYKAATCSENSQADLGGPGASEEGHLGSPPLSAAA